MLIDRLSEYGNRDIAPFHMPGHKRNIQLLGENLPYGIDITEIDGFDNLQDPQSVLKETAEIAAQLYGSKRSFLLVNGSTGGLLAAIRSAVRHGDTVLLARNCHKAVYNAVEMNGLVPVYVLPELDESTGIAGSITPEQVQKALEEHAEVRLIIVTSPTYEGVVSDIEAIARLAHDKNIALLVDSAHGAHMGFDGFFPPSALKCGADLVVTSLHKTLPALTQCALLHVAGEIVDERVVLGEISVFQTSSPSYVLLSSIDCCVRLLAKEHETLFSAYIERLKEFDQGMKGLKKISVLCYGADAISKHQSFWGFDPGKIVVGLRGTDQTGSAFTQRLRTEYGIELEMAAPDYAIAMTSVCDTKAQLKRLTDALLDIDKKTGASDHIGSRTLALGRPELSMTAGKARDKAGDFVRLEASSGRVCLEYVWVYPPGIPLIVPGELIAAGTVEAITDMHNNGMTLKSSKGRLPDSIFCWQEPRFVYPPKPDITLTNTPVYDNLLTENDSGRTIL